MELVIGGEGNRNRCAYLGGNGGQEGYGDHGVAKQKSRKRATWTRTEMRKEQGCGDGLEQWTESEVHSECELKTSHSERDIHRPHEEWDTKLPK